MLAGDELSAAVARLAPGIARDPRPAPALRIGAMGHRVIAPETRAAVNASVERVFALIRAAAEAALVEPAVRARYAGALNLSVISPLAEGADQVIAIAGMKAGFALGTILPFAPANYELTFDLPERLKSIEDFRNGLARAALPGGHGVIVFDGNPLPATRDAAFLACGAAIVRASDILIAILSDGRGDSQTAQSVNEAIESGMPVILVDPAQPETFALWFEGVRADDAEAKLRASVHALLAGSHVHHGAHGIGLADYAAERVDCDTARPTDFEYAGPYRARTMAPWWARWCGGLNRFIERRFRVRHKTAEKEPAPSFTELPFARGEATPYLELFLRFQRADVLASAYAELYRSAQLIIALLGIATVALGAVNILPGFWAPILAGLELATLSLALGFVWISHRQHWLDRWMGYRLIAEIFRYAKFLLLAGRPSPFETRGHTAANRPWTRDFVEAVLRAVPLSLPGRGAEADARAVPTIGRYLEAHCIDDQIAFHQNTGPARLRLAAALKRLSLVVSLVTVVVVAAKFLLEGALFWIHVLPIGETTEPWLKLGEILGVVLPAVTAATLALRAYGEHDVVAKRAHAMIADLRGERRRVGRATDLNDLGEAMMRVARVLLRDVDGWLELFADKHLE